MPPFAVFAQVELLAQPGHVPRGRSVRAQRHLHLRRGGPYAAAFVRSSVPSSYSDIASNFLLFPDLGLQILLLGHPPFPLELVRYALLPVFALQLHAPLFICNRIIFRLGWLLDANWRTKRLRFKVLWKDPWGNGSFRRNRHSGKAKGCKVRRRLVGSLSSGIGCMQSSELTLTARYC